MSLQTATDALANQLNQFLQFGFVWCLDVLKSGSATLAIHVDAIQKQDMKVNVEVKGAAKALDQRYCPGGAILEREPGFVDQMSGDRPVHDTEHLAHCLGMGSEQVP